jgi:hypothetical protein
LTSFLFVAIIITKTNLSAEDTMIKFRLLLALLMTLTASAAWATMTVVAQDGSGNFATVQDAFDACADNDTIIIVPGNYGVATLSNHDHVVVMGAGFNAPATTLAQLNVRNCTHCEFWSMKVAHEDNSLVLEITDGTDNTFRRCWFILLGTSGYALTVVSLQGTANNTIFLDDVFEGYTAYLYAPCKHTFLSGTGLISGCLFKGNWGTFTIVTGAGSAGQWAVSNCCFSGAPGNIDAISGSGQVDLRNSVLYNATLSTAWPYLQADYNASNNTLPGDHNILLTVNPFVDADAGDFHLNEASSCWDVGDPGIHARYARGHDANLSDMGCYGGMTPRVDGGLPPQTAVTSLSVTPMVTVGDSIYIRSTGVGAPRY